MELSEAVFCGLTKKVQSLMSQNVSLNFRDKVELGQRISTLHNTSPHTVSLYTAELGEVTVCLCPHRMAGLLFTWQLKKVKLMW